VAELLLELLSEEIPARMQRRAIDDLTGLLEAKLAAAEIPAAGWRGYVTPRRLAVLADGIPSRQSDRIEERRGPRVGSPQQAIDGFLRGAGIDSIERCEVRATDRGEFYFARIERPGGATVDVLPDLIYSAIGDMAWPKSMRYPASSLRWVRPLKSVICLFDGAVLPLPLGDVPVGRMTQGHRFLSKGGISVDNAADYLAKLYKAHVVLDPVKRRQIIADGLDRLSKSEGLTVKDDPALLDEVTGLVEFPVVMMGTIDDESMALPPEVLATAMRAHQRYFSCLKPDGSLAPRFLFVANNRAADGGRTIVAGNERVLRARLTDARFFWDHDRTVRLENRVAALADRVFHAKLGSVYDKVERIQVLAYNLARLLRQQTPEFARRAAFLAKADLSTGMVGEFPELQGIMGRYYALHDGEHDCVANAIADHYRPGGPSDVCPSPPVSVAVALADKIDSLVGFFAVDEKPSGSRDPFALRRAALGVIRLILENGLRLPLGSVFRQALSNFDHGRCKLNDPSGELLDFIADRLKVHLRERGVRHDLIAAAFAQVGKAEDDLTRLLKRVDALESFLASEDGANLLTAYRRASNIVSIEERKDGCSHGGEMDPALLRQLEERTLVERLGEIGSRAGTLLEREEFDKAMTELARLRPAVDAFFDKVTVNCGEAALRENRLRLLSRIRETMNELADFSQIEG
jgi:glycyl-tRNA synthetase beta chain